MGLEGALALVIVVCMAVRRLAAVGLLVFIRELWMGSKRVRVRCPERNFLVRRIGANIHGSQSLG